MYTQMFHPFSVAFGMTLVFASVTGVTLGGEKISVETAVTSLIMTFALTLATQVVLSYRGDLA